MRVRIHRGADEIGGSCVEVEASGSRLVLDVGRPLNAERDEVIELPQVPGFESHDPSLLGVIITHAHQDHWVSQARYRSAPLSTWVRRPTGFSPRQPSGRPA